jgi:hypothetical protein
MNSKSSTLKSHSSYLNYNDQSGNYNLKREIKYQKGKLVTRVKLFSTQSTKELESIIAVSSIGRLQKAVALLPEISQFRVWFDQKEHFSQIKLNRKTQSLDIISKAPVTKWNFERQYKLPKGKYYCFFSQLPECLKEQNLLAKTAGNKKVQVFVIWDNFPYHNEQYEGLGEEPFVRATLTLEGHDKNMLKFGLDLGNQSIYLHFNQKIEFVAYYWISQGISAVSSVKKEQ